MTNKLRCICGKSKQLPWCDGSHKEDDWACEVKTEQQLQLVIMGPHSLTNLTKRLAWRFEATVYNHQQSLKGDTLIILDDGTGLASLPTILTGLTFEKIYFIGLGVDLSHAAVNLNLTDSTVVNIEPAKLFFEIETKVNQWLNGVQHHTPTMIPSPYKNIFISHAVTDEALLVPVVTAARELTGLNIFMCFDSIQQGDKWRRKINSTLNEADLFIFVISKDSLRSTYCAFETGMALSQNKPIRLISLDSSLPPAYISHLHAIDLPRQMRNLAWLNLPSALLKNLLEIIHQQ